jgi:hypothetical protein
MLYRTTDDRAQYHVFGLRGGMRARLDLRLMLTARPDADTATAVASILAGIAVIHGSTVLAE